MARAACFAVIMAGGQGTRFWPRSRRRLPKQLLAIAGRKSMLRETIARARQLCSPERILIVTGAAHADAVRGQAGAIPARNIVIEPAGRNTAPCIAAAAEIIARRSAGDPTMIVLPADHAIADAAAFAAAVRRAVAVAERKDCLVTLGIRPRYPELGYGYIEIGESCGGGSGRGVYWARAFHEKPAAAAARRYVRDGRHLWNSGMFVWRTSVIRAEIARQLPWLGAALRPLGQARTAAQQQRAIRRAYRGIKGVSIDHGVMEGARRVAVVAARCGWNDVGSWAAMPALWGTDQRGNAVRGRAVLVDSAANVVFSPQRLVALVGVRDLIVVESEDAVLICRGDRAQDVRQVVAEIERRRLRRLL